MGLPEFTIDGRILSGRAYQKLHALLAFLLMEHERPHTRESLSALLWPDHDKERALRNLRLGLHHLRQGLGRHGAALIVGDRRTIRIAPGHPFLLDALELGAPLPSGASTASLEHLVALYRGDFLTGLALPGCEEFEAWTRSHADTLRRTVLRLLERLGDECEAHGEVEHALQAARRRIQIEPWSDPAHRQVMRLLARAGQTDAALEQFRAFATTLQQELGTAPQADTVALVERIRRGEPLQGEAPPAAPAAPGERQLLTVIAIRSLDQPRVGEDPELWAERISRFTARLAALVLELGGTLAATPDGAWVGAFGFPHAEEGAARRAVQAALRIAALGDEERGESQFAVGVHTAVALSDGVHADRGGMVTAVATALARAAEGGGVLISGATELQTRSLFEIEPQEDALPAAAGSAFHVLRPSGAVDRLDRAPLTPLRGRRDELRLLLDLWRAAQGGQAEAVLLLGEAGIGKSRLVHTVSEQLRAADNHVERALRCRAEFRDAAYYPIIELIESLAGYAPNDAAPLKNAAVARLLDEHGADGVKALPFIARLLGLADDPALAALAPAQLREHTEQAVLALFLNPAKRHPLLFVCEDLHWADPSTLGFLSRFIGAAEPGYRILALLTARPGERPPALAGLRTLALGPLDDG
ncbi:MAG: AAA family ATPase, partial [Sulfuricella sp.]|nr:AAA family ATPase [Sulfuricella sp.]